MIVSYKSVWPYYSVHLLLLISIIALYVYNDVTFPLWILYGLIPVVDTIWPLDVINPTQEEQKVMKNEIKWKFPLWIWGIADFATMFYFTNVVITRPFTPLQLTLMLLSAAQSALGSINVAHECMHKKDSISRFFGWALMLKCFYMHFVIEHTQGHHKHVATREDPASAQMNQNIYSFIPQSFIGGYKSSWKIEQARVKRNNLPFYYNRILMIIWLYPIYLGVLYFWSGIYGVIYIFISAAGGVALLECVNYIEHYGLRRQKLENGEYEPVDIRHSWNAPYSLTNYLFFKLQRHSDHHENGHKEYQILCTYDKSPMLPGSYMVWIFACLIPPLWFTMMNPIAEAYNTKTKPQSLDAAKNALVTGVMVQAALFTFLRFYAL